MLYAMLGGGTYPPPGVPDTPANRKLWAQTAAEIAAMAAKGIIPDIPAGAVTQAEQDED